MTRKQKKRLYRILAASAGIILVELLPVDGLLRLALYLCIYFVIGSDVLSKASRGIINGSVFDENFLMAVATVGAFVLAIITRSGDYLEGVAVMLFYQIGELFQSCAVGKSRKNISALMDIRPDYANIEKDGHLEQVDPEEVAVGTCIVVQPGEKIPLDGIVLEGTASLNTSALTGESLPVDVKEGYTVISGCINLSGLLKIQTTKAFAESTAAKILDLVENASSRKSRAEDFIARFARVYTPFVCCSALLLALIPPVVQLLLTGSGNWMVWFYRGLSFLVVSCPCALVISIPLTFFAGIGGASREGILVKGSNYLEALAKARCVVFDKTGTLTQGVFEVSGIHHNGLSEEEILYYTAHAECASSHPISKSLQKAYGKEIDRNCVSEIREISGHGILARVDGRTVAVGNDKLMRQQNLECIPCHEPGTVIHVAVDGVYQGHIVISDQIKPNAGNAIARLKKVGIRRIVMLTGDSAQVAQKTAQSIGIEEVHSQLLPGDKVDEVEKLLEQTAGKGNLVFVGDGINDAPVLTRADIGIAMGAMGSDAAIEAADVVLMDDNPEHVARAIRIARKCLGIVKQNIVFSLVVKFGCLGLVAIGVANMWAAIFADVGVMVLAVLNAIRALKIRED